MRKARLDEAQAGIKTARRNINNRIYGDNATLMAGSKEELKSLLMKVKEKNRKSWLKIQHSEKLRSWHLVPSLHSKQMQKQWKQWQTLFSWAPKSLQMVTAAKKLKTLAPWRKAMTNLDSILKSRDITLPKKVRLVKAMVFPVVNAWMWELDHKKAECRRTDTFKLWCWRRLLRVPWTARRSNQLILKEISP